MDYRLALASIAQYHSQGVNILTQPHWVKTTRAGLVSIALGYFQLECSLYVYVEISILFKSSGLFLEQGERGALAGLLAVLFKKRAGVSALSVVLKLVVSAACDQPPCC